MEIEIKMFCNKEISRNQRQSCFRVNGLFSQTTWLAIIVFIVLYAYNVQYSACIHHHGTVYSQPTPTTIPKEVERFPQKKTHLKRKGSSERDRERKSGSSMENNMGIVFPFSSWMSLIKFSVKKGRQQQQQSGPSKHTQKAYVNIYKTSYVPSHFST